MARSAPANTDSGLGVLLATPHNRRVGSIDHRPRLWPVATKLALVAYALSVWHFNFLVDDAFISFRYGAHLAAGHGLTWNIGEAPPIEGFSDFLWVVLCAALKGLDLDPLLWTRIIGIGCGALLIALVARLVGARAGTGPTRFGAALFAALLPPIGVWATGGLETMAFSLAVFGVFERLTFDREAPRTAHACVWAALAVLLRADGFVWVGIALAAALLAWRRERGARLLKSVVVVASFGVAVAAAYFAFRYAYFGRLEPNTARIKVAFGSRYFLRGSQYVASLLLCVVSIPLVLLGALSVARRDASGLIVPALGAFGASCAYLIVLGGDWMMMYRMLVPALAFVALAFGCWLGSMRSGLVRMFVGGVCALLTLLPSFDVHLVPRSWRERAHFRWGHAIPAEPGSASAAQQKSERERIAALEQQPDDATARAELAQLWRQLEYCSEYAMWRKGVVDIENWIEVGRALGLHTKPGESMVLGNIGAFGYFAPELVVYDTQGLTNTEPLLPVDPDARTMPGHDRKIEIAGFEKYSPTYYNARIVNAAAPWTILPRAWLDFDADGAALGPNETARAKFEFVLAPLDAAKGFRANTLLLLIKHRR